MGWVLMSEREVHRIEVLSCVVERSMTVAHAAAVLCLSERQVQRLLKIFRKGSVMNSVYGFRPMRGLAVVTHGSVPRR